MNSESTFACENPQLPPDLATRAQGSQNGDSLNPISGWEHSLSLKRKLPSLGPKNKNIPWKAIYAKRGTTFYKASAYLHVSSGVRKGEGFSHHDQVLD
jgi:hypothetical protein